jgi:hypothetical protein
MWQPVKWVQVDQVQRIVREELEKLAKEEPEAEKKSR